MTVSSWISATGGSCSHRRAGLGGPDQAIRLIGSTPPAWTGLGPSPTAACLELGLRRLPHHRVVFGVDEPTYLSTHCPPADLAPPGHAVVHVMRYQPVDDTMPADAQRALLREVVASAGIDGDDIVEERFLARMVVDRSPADGRRRGPGRSPPVDGGRPPRRARGRRLGRPDRAAQRRRRGERREAGRLAADRDDEDGGGMSASPPTCLRSTTRSSRSARACSASPTGSPARAPTPRTSCRTPGCAGSAPSGPRSSAPRRGSPR